MSQRKQQSEETWITPSKGMKKHGSAINVVIDTPARTAWHWGLSPAEADLLGASINLLKKRGCGVFISVEHHAAETDAERRILFRDVKNYIATFQRKKGMERLLYVEVLESNPSLHSHLIVVMPTKKDADWLICRLLNSAFAKRITDKGCKRIWGWDGLERYLKGEAAPQTWWKDKKSYPRVKGSRSGEMTGDRVRPSKDLERVLLARGDIKPRTRTYTKTGKPRKQRRRVPIQPVQLTLPIAAPPVPVLQLVEAARKEQGLSQRQMAERLGIRQPAYSNAIVRGHDKLGGWALNRALDFVADRLAP